MISPAEQEAVTRRQNTDFDQACANRDEKVHRYIEPLLAYFNALEQEIDGMPIAKRFRRDKGPSQLAEVGLANPALRGQSEAEDKRARLQLRLNSIRGEVML
ncbi:hypothetical protein CMO96_01365 [Candidatus Woesebacteria bacterium]|nr:hypothetical protein [Candidatus Woesebacteria bacterium]